MHRAIEEGRIGRVAVAECLALFGRDRAYFARDAWRGTWKGEGGGALMNQAIHMIDMLLWMVGVPTEVYGRWATLKHGDYIDVEDSSCAVVSFDNGALATITVTTTLESIEKAPGFRIAVQRDNHLMVRFAVITRDSVSRERTEEVTSYANYHALDGVQTPLQVARTRDGRRIFQAFYDTCTYNPNLTPDFFTKAALEQRFREVGSKADRKKAAKAKQD